MNGRPAVDGFEKSDGGSDVKLSQGFEGLKVSQAIGSRRSREIGQKALESILNDENF
jgi:hypothetical protein